MDEDENVEKHGGREVAFGFFEPTDFSDEMLPFYVGNLEAGLTAYLDVYSDYEQANDSLDRGLNLALRGIMRAALDEGGADVPPLITFLIQSALTASMANIDLYLRQVQRLGLLLTASRALAERDPDGPLGGIDDVPDAQRWVAAKIRGPRGRNLEFMERINALKRETGLHLPDPLRLRLLAAREARNAIAHGPVTKRFEAWPGVVQTRQIDEGEQRHAVTLEALQDYLAAFDELAGLVHQAMMRSNFGAGVVIPDVELGDDG